MDTNHKTRPQSSNCSVNALKHGMFSRQLRLPWEHPDKYASLEMRLRDELSPEGILEEDSVFEILLLLIMRQRAMETMTCIFFRDPLSRELRKCGTSAVDRQKFFEQRAHEEGGKIRDFSISLHGLRRRLSGLERVVKDAKPDLLARKLDKVIAYQKEEVEPALEEMRELNRQRKRFDTRTAKKLKHHLNYIASLGAQLDKALTRFWAKKEIRKYLPKSGKNPTSTASSSLLPSRHDTEPGGSLVEMTTSTQDHQNDEK